MVLQFCPLVLIILLWYHGKFHLITIVINSIIILSRTIPDGNPIYGINVTEFQPVERIISAIS
jgi:hypothetical protein